jgi:predicted RNA-binding Zn-ribbon protein involved in translation (DUF1610 family)
MTVTNQVKQEHSIDAVIYSNPSARKIVELMLRSPRTPITPEITDTDEIRYPQLETSEKLELAEMKSLLTEMTTSRVILADRVDQTPACPECGSTRLSTRYLCPKCFSYDIARSYLYEHLKCGKVAGDEAFRKLDQIVCPKCQTVLHSFGVEYRAVGAWYKCAKCNESFNAPAHAHFCRPSHHQFTSDRTRLVPIYQYRLNPESLSEIRRQLLTFSDAVAMLEGLGLTVFAPHSLAGNSGEAFSFDVVVQIKGRWGSPKIFAIDIISSEGGVIAESVREFVSKVRGARPTGSYLLVIPFLTDEARSLAQGMKVVFIEAPSVSEATAALIDREFKNFRGD